MADPNPPATSASNPLVTHTSNMLIGDRISKGEYVDEWNATITKKDSQGSDITETYTLRMFHTEEGFVKEKRAYERMIAIPALSGHVPVYYGTTYQHHSILLGKCDGRKLKDIISTVSNERRLTFEWRVAELLQILHEGGVAHCNITSKDIVIRDNGDVQLVNFSRANLKEDFRQEFMWDNCQDMDKDNVNEIFLKVDSAKAKEEVARIVEGVRNGATLAMPQARLGRLLSQIAGPSMGLLRTIMDVFKHPEPELALPLAARLVHRKEHDEAIEMLTQAATRFENQALPPSDPRIKQIAQMKITAAKYEIDAERGYEGTDLPPSNGRCEEAVRYYLSSVEKATPADDDVMKLRYELADHLFYLDLEGHAMDVCVRALGGALESKGGVSQDVMDSYRELIKQTKDQVGYYIQDIREDMQKGGEEDSWRPRAELPTYEQAYRRAEEADTLWKAIRNPHGATVTETAGVSTSDPVSEEGS